MKKIEAIIRHEKLGDVKRAIKANGYSTMMYHDIWYRGTMKEIDVMNSNVPLYDVMAKIKIEVIVEDAEVEKMINAICESAHTGATGDGKIFVLPVEEAVRIQTREHGGFIL